MELRRDVPRQDDPPQDEDPSRDEDESYDRFTVGDWMKAIAIFALAIGGFIAVAWIYRIF